MKYLFLLILFFVATPVSAYDGQPWEITASGTVSVYMDGIGYTEGWTRSTLRLMKGTYPSGSEIGSHVVGADNSQPRSKAFENAFSCTVSGSVATCNFEAHQTGDSDYWLDFYAPNNATPTVTGQWYNFSRSGGVWDTEGQPPLTVTRVIEVLPATTTATSSSFVTSVSGYVNNDEYVVGTNVVLNAVRKSSSQQVSMVQAYENALNPAPYTYSFVFPVTSSGAFDFSTTTDTSLFLEGEYSLTAYIDIPAEDVGGFFASIWDNFMRTLEQASGNSPSERTFQKTVTFTIGQPTWYDTVINGVIAERQLDGVDPAVCSPFSVSFGIIDCLTMLVIPSQSQIAAMWSNLYGNIMTHQPFGWVARFIEIITFGESVQPPALTYTYGDSSPEELQGKTITIQIFDKFDFVNSIESDTTHKTIWDIVMPYFNTIIALGVLGVILSDILQLSIPKVGDSDSGGYTKTGSVPVYGLPDQKTQQQVTYGAPQNVKIHDRTRRRIM